MERPYFHNSNVPLVANLIVTILMRVTIMDRMNINPVNPVILSKRPAAGG